MGICVGRVEKQALSTFALKTDGNISHNYKLQIRLLVDRNSPSHLISFSFYVVIPKEVVVFSQQHHFWQLPILRSQSEKKWNGLQASSALTAPALGH